MSKQWLGLRVITCSCINVGFLSSGFGVEFAKTKQKNNITFFFRVHFDLPVLFLFLFCFLNISFLCCLDLSFSFWLFCLPYTFLFGFFGHGFFSCFFPLFRLRLLVSISIVSVRCQYVTNGL